MSRLPSVDSETKKRSDVTSGLSFSTSSRKAKRRYPSIVNDDEGLQIEHLLRAEVPLGLRSAFPDVFPLLEGIHAGDVVAESGAGKLPVSPCQELLARVKDPRLADGTLLGSHRANCIGISGRKFRFRYPA